MCGITGKVNLKPGPPPEESLIQRMVHRLRHRGPDGTGIYTDSHAAMGHARLSILDLSGGKQPLSNEDDTIWIVFNGEVFNYVELREELEKRGHRFKTRTDTEVIVHAFEEHGPDCLDDFIGDFAFALWDKKNQHLFCARDRMGVRPFFYTVADGALIFASEMKSIFCDPAVEARLSPRSLLQTFIFWSPLSPRSIFEEIHELPPGHMLEMRHGEVATRPYWRMKFPEEESKADRSVEDCVEELRALMEHSVKIRLRADVPVGSYLSGGLDSSAVTALMRHVGHDNMKTFSLVFEDQVYDESPHQLRLAEYLGTNHQQLVCKYSDIAAAFPDAIWHTETPVLRTATTPMFLLSGLVRDHDIKVVLTGEGADEVLAGYDIFKENKIRRFWARQPESKARPLLLQRLYPYFAMSMGRSQAYLEAFFGEGLTNTSDPLYSHMTRFYTTEKNQVFFSEQLQSQLEGQDEIEALRERIRPMVEGMDALSAAQYIESTTLLPCYILCSQGDRPMMAHAVEGRVPYLDHRVAELAARIPSRIRMRGLVEKFALREAVQDLLPEDISRRTKQPYMAPESKSFLADGAPEYVSELLSPKRIAEAGYFNPTAVNNLVAKCKRRDVVGFRDNMAFVGILSTQLVHSMFVEGQSAEAFT